MNWSTLYITGRADFRSDVRKKIENAGLNVIPGYIDNVAFKRGVHNLYWLDDAVDLRTFKQAIGSRIIWKYRLRFYTNLEDFIQAQTVRRNTLAFTEEDNRIISGMRSLFLASVN